MTDSPRGIQLFGVNGRTGRYALPRISSGDLAEAAIQSAAPAELLSATRRCQAEQESAELEGMFRPEEGVSVRGRKRPPGWDLPDWEIAKRGWGVVFSASDSRVSEIREALEPLLALRREQVRAVSEQHYRDLVYLPGELMFDFRKRYRAAAGVAEPKKIPGYLLLIGGPKAIPFDFQSELAALDYAVGRLDFESIQEFAHYAESVAREERPEPASVDSLPARRVTFFAPEHPDDALSHESARRLAAPLSDACALPGDGWTVERVLGERATKHRFSELLTRENPPSILFTAGHGAVFECGDDRQADHQGALVCADWQGPESAAISESDYYSASDLDDDVQLGGMIAFHFACCSLGVPAQNDLHLAGLPIPKRLAPHDLIARLPQGLLAHGALAAIGHLDLVFAYSFQDGQGGEGETPEPPPIYLGCLASLLRGLPVGEAMGSFRSSYQARLVERDGLFHRIRARKKVAAETLWEVGAACHDAKYYAIFGDPAVRLAPRVEVASGTTPMA